MNRIDWALLAVAVLLGSTDVNAQEDPLPRSRRTGHASTIGDTETLSEVAETVFGLLARRTNESVASHVLYRATIPKDLDWILQAVGIVAKGS